MKNIILAVSTVIGSFIAAFLGGVVSSSTLFGSVLSDDETRKHLISELSDLDSLQNEFDEFDEEQQKAAVGQLISIILMELDRIDAEKFYNSPLYEDLIMDILESLIVNDDRFDQEEVIEEMKLIKESNRNFSKVKRLFQDLESVIH